MALVVTPADAAKELLARQRAAESLVDYAQYIEVPGAPVVEDESLNDWVYHPVGTGLADHHKLTLEVVERVIIGDLPRAMFFMPPGSAKSTYGSVVAPTWAMGRELGMKIILTSYGSDLAKKHGRKGRAITRSKEFRAVFEHGLTKDSTAADEWALTNGSEYMSAGILSGITGNRAHGIIIDDPIKGREQADSQTIRDKTWDAYQDDLRTRLIPGGWEIIIQTRWHEDDLAGRILPKDYNGESGLLSCQDGRDWYIVNLPAICEREDDPLGRKKGERLWAEWFTDDHFAGFMAVPRTWSALFQQRPAPDSGTFFKRAWFKRFNPHELPTNVNVYAASDFAVTDEEEGEDPDYTEHGVWNVDCEGDLWMGDWWFDQTTSDKWIESLLDLIKDNPVLCWFGEGGVIRRAVEPFLKKRISERKIYFRVEWVNPITNKAARARSFQALAAQGKVHIPYGPDGDRVIDQIVSFPSGKHDDAVDVCSLIGLAINQAHPAMIIPEKQTLSMAERDMMMIHGQMGDHGHDDDHYMEDF